MSGSRRQLQIALGLLWFLDGALQLQPFMLGPGFARQILAPNAAGQPELVAAPILWAVRLIGAHPVAWDVPFAAVQLLLGVGLLVPRTARRALAASIPWALGVWFFGEGLAGIAGGHASLLTGAPGAALLYGVLALAAWPTRDASQRPARWLPFAWAVVWIGGAVFQALPGQNTGGAVAAALGSGDPGWLGRADAWSRCSGSSSSASETRRPSPAQPPLDGIVLGAVLPRSPDEEGADDRERHGDEDDQEDGRERVHRQAPQTPVISIVCSVATKP
jgi:hypothetical protein